MDDQQILDTINSLQDFQERRRLRDQFQQEGRTEGFRAALAEALGRQARKTQREEAVMRPARWVARKTGGLVGRTIRRLEREAEKADQH
jgi:hypothetical protein